MRKSGFTSRGLGKHFLNPINVVPIQKRLSYLPMDDGGEDDAVSQQLDLLRKSHRSTYFRAVFDFAKTQSSSSNVHKEL